MTLWTLIEKNKFWWMMGTALVLMAIFQAAFVNDKTSQETDPALEDITTFIPKGYRLVPIPVANYKSLEQILGNYGVVDLYVRTFKNAKTHTELIGSGIRALRPKNGSESIGLLVPVEQVGLLLQREGQFYLALNNSDVTGTVFEKKSLSKQKKRLFYEQ